MNQLPNCPVTWDDIMADEEIFGPNLGYLKDNKNKRATPVVVATRINI